MTDTLTVDIKGEIKSLICKNVDSYNAITELIDDSIDATASNIKISLTNNELKNIDNGLGFTDEAWSTIDELKKLKVRPSVALGSFGIGRILTLCALGKSDGGKLTTLTLSKDKSNVRSHEFKYDVNGNDINTSTTKEGSGDETSIFFSDTLDTDLNSLTRQEEKLLLKKNMGTITKICTNNEINKTGYTDETIIGKLGVTYYGYLQNNSITFNDTKVKGFDRLHLHELDDKFKKKYEFQLRVNEGQFVISHNDIILNIPALSGPKNKSLEEMYTEDDISDESVLVSNFSITLCKVSEKIHGEDLAQLEFLKKGDKGRLTTYVCGVAITRNGLREMGNPEEVITWYEDINTKYLRCLRGMINYDICSDLSEKDLIKVNDFFGVTSEKDLIGSINNMLKKLTKCLVHADRELFDKPTKTKPPPTPSSPSPTPPTPSSPTPTPPTPSPSTSPSTTPSPSTSPTTTSPPTPPGINVQPKKKEVYKPKQLRRGGNIVKGFLYLWTLEDSKDWKIDGKTIYKFGETTREYLDRINEHQRNHPTKKIQIKGIWTVSGPVEKENEILSHFQTTGLQYKAWGTGRSEFVISDNVENVIDVINGLVPPNSQMK